MADLSEPALETAIAKVRQLIPSAGRLETFVSSFTSSASHIVI